MLRTAQRVYALWGGIQAEHPVGLLLFPCWSHVNVIFIANVNKKYEGNMTPPNATESVKTSGKQKDC